MTAPYGDFCGRNVTFTKYYTCDAYIGVLYNGIHIDKRVPKAAEKRASQTATQGLALM